MVQSQSNADDTLAKLVARAKVLRKDGTTEDEKWMLDLHRDLTARFISDNTRIWTTGSIFVAIAFASLAISPDVMPSDGMRAFAAAGTSVSLLVIWNLIADRHREFQDRSFQWMSAIESFYLPTEAPKRSGVLRQRLGLHWRSARWFLGVIQRYCGRNRLPPLQALAINARTRLPGDGYHGSPRTRSAHARAVKRVQLHPWPRAAPF